MLVKSHDIPILPTSWCLVPNAAAAASAARLFFGSLGSERLKGSDKASVDLRGSKPVSYWGFTGFTGVLLGFTWF